MKGERMKFYRCLICGDPYMGSEKPSHCPFCGAREEHLVSAAEWVDENESISELTGTSRANLEQAMQLEVNNKAFYADASARADLIELQGIFKNLSKIEGEHASTIKKILKVEPPEPEQAKKTASDSIHENLEAARKRETFASSFYAQSAGEATEERVKKVFSTLSEIESDHIQLESALLERGL
jgi:rubrerythrin